MTRSASIVVSLMLLTAAAPHSAGASSNVVDLDVPDVELVDQNNRSGRFVSDVIGDRLAAVTFTFTSCTTICPVLDGIFLGVQAKIADDLGDDIILVSVTVDPANDIPQRLKARAEELDADPAWTFLTGDKDTVNGLLKALEVYAPNIWDHPPTVFVVDGRRGVWTRLYGFPSPDKIVEVLDRYRSARDAR
ncbi:MAG TPA: SCO family protein [Candidatus Sulfomarinibacteraceae bacterium]|nr:SCO family protein [Candidatus Sulfomarinibacteraceae bacterium]